MHNLSVLATKYPKLKEVHFWTVNKKNDEFALKITEAWKDLRVVDLCYSGFMQQGDMKMSLLPMLELKFFLSLPLIFIFLF